MGDCMSLASVVGELQAMQIQFRERGEYRNANVLDFAIGYLDKCNNQNRNNPDWEICWICDKQHTSECNPNLCNPLDI